MLDFNLYYTSKAAEARLDELLRADARRPAVITQRAPGDGVERGTPSAAPVSERCAEAATQPRRATT
jgi:hypothetical protein